MSDTTNTGGEVDVSALPPQIQEMIRQAVDKAIATYHPGEAAPPPPETPEETAKRLLANLFAAINGESAVVSGSGRVHGATHDLLAHLVAVVFPDKTPTVVESTPPVVSDSAASDSGAV